MPDVRMPDGTIIRNVPEGTTKAELQRRLDASRNVESDQIGWSDVPGMAARNFLPSAGQLVEDTVTPFLHPVETGKALGNLAVGVGQKVAKSVPQMDNNADSLVALRERLGMSDPGPAPIMRGENKEPYAEAVGDFFADRYGGLDELKNALANDPAGVLADLSAVLTGGASIAARAPGTVGRTASVVGKVGRAVDPVNIAAKGAKEVGGRVAGPLTAVALGSATGAGPTAVKEAAAAGRAGGKTGDAFTAQMRGTAPVEDVVTDAKTALNRMKQERSAAYRSGMADVAQDTTVIDFAPIDAALDKLESVGTFKGEVSRPTAAKAMAELRAVVEEWKALDPVEYHTPEGLDALKQKISDVGKTYDPMTQSQARMIADQVYNAIKSEIVNQAPVYADVMKGYESASDLINEIERTLSVNPKANIDTTVRKLQSVMRNNANTNYGRRVDLAEKLGEAGAPNLMPRLAGQALSSPLPRGIQGALSPLAAFGVSATNPYLLPLLAGTSPRVVGEGAYYAGRVAGAAGQMTDALRGVGLSPRGIAAGSFQAGRLEDNMQPVPMPSYQPRNMRQALGVR